MATLLARPYVQVALLAFVCLGIYSNNFVHEYFLDDFHFITGNPSLRSLANIPSFFVDPSTLSILRAHADYRPVLQASYALNFWMGGYDTAWWHATQILLHFVCVVGLYLICKRILRQLPDSAPERHGLAFVPMLAALVYALQPTASGVVNYLTARSSLLTAAFLFMSLVVYMVPREEERYRRTPWIATILFTFALFTKVEAIGCLAVFFLYEVWQTARASEHQRQFFGDLLASLNRRTLHRMWPLLAVTVVYFVIRQVLLAPYETEVARRQQDVTSLDYLLTQFVVWWQYVLNWLAPLNLIADNASYPVYRSLLQKPVMLALAGWLLVGGALLAAWRTRPWLAFLAISALALLSPTSSIAPLAEMLNEHRPYMPLAILSLCWIIPLGAVPARIVPASRQAAAVVALGFALVLVTLASLTWERNRVFSTDRSYLEDLIAKAPSGRTLNNYGLKFMAEGDYATALEHFESALKFAPNWYIVHSNLAIAYRVLGDTTRSREHFDKSVQFDSYTATALQYRAEDHIRSGRFREAASDFERASVKSLEHYRLCKGLATAYAGMGDAERSFEQTSRCIELDNAQVGFDIVAISTPFFAADSLLPAGLRYFELLAQRLPGTWWVHANIGTLAMRMGDTARAAVEIAKAEALKK